MKKLLIALLLLTLPAYAADVDLGAPYADGGTVTAANLNGKFTAITTQVNGGLDNDNANTAQGYRFYEAKAILPSAGTQGRAVFQLSDNTFNLDTGSAWLATVTPSGTLATGKIPYYNGGWTLLTPGTQYYSLISNGASSLPSYQQVGLTTGVTGTLPIANGGTNITTYTQGDILYSSAANTLSKLAAGTNGQFLQTQGAGANPQWASVTTPALTLKSTTSVSGADSGTITLTAGKTYKIVGKLQNGTNSQTNTLIFNGDTGTNYWIIGGASASRANILLTGTGAVSSSDILSFELDLIQGSATSDIFISNGASFYSDSTGGFLRNNITGVRYMGASAVTSFMISVTSGTMTGTIWVYEYSGT